MADIIVNHLSKKFYLQADGKEQVVNALEDISFSVSSEEIVALAGPSGCGKTTTLRIIMGLETATSGSVMMNERMVTGCGYDRGMVFQNPELLPWRTALGNVEFGLELKGVKREERRSCAARNLELVGLKDWMNQRPYQLSGGMQQRVGIARALATDPDVLLMDEPFGALDAQTREILQAELLAIHQKTRKTILFVTHDLDEAVLLADRVVLMAVGRVQEIVDINLPRPRGDVLTLRGMEEFTKKRYHLWKTLHEAPQPAHIA